jgi:hypothetical protein
MHSISNASKASKDGETLVGWQLAGAFSADVLSIVAALGWYRRESNPQVYRERECFRRVPAWNTVVHRGRRNRENWCARLALVVWLLVAPSTKVIALGALKRGRGHCHRLLRLAIDDRLPTVACAMLKAGSSPRGLKRDF